MNLVTINHHWLKVGYHITPCLEEAKNEYI
jgi:hypothetical protein